MISPRKMSVPCALCQDVRIAPLLASALASLLRPGRRCASRGPRADQGA